MIRYGLPVCSKRGDENTNCQKLYYSHNNKQTIFGKLPFEIAQSKMVITWLVCQWRWTWTNLVHLRPQIVVTLSQGQRDLCVVKWGQWIVLSIDRPFHLQICPC